MNVVALYELHSIYPSVNAAQQHNGGKDAHHYERGIHLINLVPLESEYEHRTENGTDELYHDHINDDAVLGSHQIERHARKLLRTGHVTPHVTSTNHLNLSRILTC